MGKKDAKPVETYKGTTKRFKCTCSQAYQDGQYGPGIRIWNKTKGTGEFRCTGCGSTRVI